VTKLDWTCIPIAPPRWKKPKAPSIDKALRYLDQCTGPQPQLVRDLQRKRQRDPNWRPSEDQARAILTAQHKKKK
jgi:hypothetical protein